jgi:hypothetical protein
MPIVDVGLVGPSYQARSRQLDFQECINFYPEIEDPASKNVKALIGCPGKVLLVNITVAGSVRGMHTTADGRLFVVVGGSLVEVFANGKYNTIGSLNTILNTVSMADNGAQGNQLVICDGIAGYLLNLSTGEFGQIVDGPWTAGIAYADFTDGTISHCPGGTHVVFKDGWFIMNLPGTGQFFLSNLYDGLMWNPTIFATAEGSPDNLISILRTNNEIWLFGTQSAEVWYTSSTAIPTWIDISQTPAANFPFSRIPNAFLDIGTDAVYSPATNGNDIFWLGSNNRGHGVVWHAQGYQAERISTHGIEYLISNLARTDDAVGYCYQQEGHFFYVLNFPTGDRTFVYDQSTGLWHERASYDMETHINHRDRGICHTYAFGKTLVGDGSCGKIYTLDLDTYTEDDGIIESIRTCPHVHNDMKRIYYYEFEADMEKGNGTVAMPVQSSSVWTLQS